MHGKRKCARVVESSLSPLRRRPENRSALPLALLTLILPAHVTSRAAFGAPRRRPAKIAVVGGSAAGVIAATVAAEGVRKVVGDGADASPSASAGVSVTLFTSADAAMPHWRRMEEEGRQLEIPILPDPTLPKRKLIESYPSGGREMAGILSERCTPAMMKEWLENCGISLKETTIGLDGMLGKEKPLAHMGGKSLVNAIEAAAVGAGVILRTGVNLTAVWKQRDGSPDTSNLFLLSLDGGTHDEVFDCIILAGEDVDYTLYSNAVEDLRSLNDSEDPLESLLSDEPLSRKERMELDKKKKKDMKRREKQAKVMECVQDGNDAISPLINDVDQSLASFVSEDSTADNKDESELNESSHEIDNFLKVFGMASNLGHTVSDPVPGMFSFVAANDGAKGGLLQGCAEDGELIPKARLSIKLDAPPKKVANRKRRARSLPKHSGPLVVRDEEVTGVAALRLSAMTANQLHNMQFDLHLHLAPDIGSVESIEEQISNHGNELTSAPCPLFHREVDYEDYDFDTGQFRQIKLPLVPGRLWGNLCKRVGIPSRRHWRDIPQKKLRALAHLVVDCPLRITSTRPVRTELSVSGGVKLKEVDMTSMESRLCDRLFLCGTVLDVHGFNGGFNSFASISTGYIAGCNAAARFSK